MEKQSVLQRICENAALGVRALHGRFVRIVRVLVGLRKEKNQHNKKKGSVSLIS